MARTTEKTPVTPAGDQASTADDSHQQGMSSPAKPEVSEHWKAKLARLAEIEKQRLIADRSANPEFNPSAWRHRPLSESEPLSGNERANKITAELSAERTRKPVKPPNAKAITAWDRPAGKARQAKARRAKKGTKGGAR